MEESDSKIIAIAAGFTHYSKPYNYPRTLLDTFIIRLQLDGDCSALIDDKLVPLAPGDLLMCQPGQLYQLVLKKGSKDYYLICQGSWVEQWWAKHQFATRMTLPMDDDLIYLWEHLAKEINHNSEPMQDLIENLIRVFCFHLQRLMSKSVQKDKPYRMKRYIELHAMEEITLEDVAKHIGVGVSWAVHLFKHAFGQSIMDYAIEVRLETAKQKIRSSAMSLEQIAEICGFNSYSYFHRQFRKRYGISPRHYRDEQWHRPSPASNTQNATK
ncbi:AraC family transcriptional regulator [Paenibacillus sp. HWE-109]|uniref:AraC family transcriptional regulator n=1 Tax=Paenibacillus sp. HWE-109 TaxID=1306526 RepID=UPI001EDDD8E7|nr:AraC family transcriptional regulator [Paenibacillus sp. HWE-109]UKS28712.1 AraC family transcriptional regulator [Paenibacillus sp. HWE-109]